MKNIIAVLLLTLAITVPSKAQTTNTPPTPSNVFVTAEQWFVTDTGFRWNAAHGYIQTGTAYENQVNIGFTVEAGVTLKHLSTNTAIGVVAENVSSTIGGASTAVAANVTLIYDVKDVQLQVGPGVWKDFVTEKTAFDLMAEAQKKTGANTHLALRGDYPIGDKKGTGNVPLLALCFGGSF